MELQVGTVPAKSVTLQIPVSGVWTAECEVDVSPPRETGKQDREIPTGRTQLRIGAQSFPCVVDPNGSGKFADRACVRLVGGAGGWSKTLLAKAYRNESGLSSSAVVTTTAAEVGEQGVDDEPQPLPSGWVRQAGPASLIFDGRKWRVDPTTGVTHVGSAWPAVPASGNVTILSFDPATKSASCASDALVVPGMVLEDARFGTLYVGDVEQVWDGTGSRITVSVSTASSSSSESRLIGVIESIARHAVKPEALTLYKYRVSSQDSEGRLRLQAMKVRGSVPDLVPAEVWTAPGISAKVRPGSLALVSFVVGREPVVVGFESGDVLELTLGAELRVWLGGEGGKPVLTTDDMSSLVQAIAAAFTAVEAKLASAMPLLAGAGAAGASSITAAGVGLVSAASLKKTMAK